MRSIDRPGPRLWVSASHPRRAAMGGWSTTLAVLMYFICSANICMSVRTLQETQRPAYQGNTRKGCVSKREKRVRREAVERCTLG